jgi:cholesterol oxidase
VRTKEGNNITRLASPIQDIKSLYDVVVVGSGYGGAIAASRLARAGRSVCLLERGKELQPGEYPDTEVEALCEMQWDLPSGHSGPLTGLYDLHINDDITVFVGCGLGGTSLVNANVSLRAEPRVFEDARWPQGLRDDLDTLLADGYRRAEEMLQPVPYPDDFPRLPKMEALKKSAAFMSEKFRLTPINVTFKDGLNQVGVEQSACKLCGDCASGCNHRAKNTVLMNYLPESKNHGAEIYTRVSVRYVARAGNRWQVHYQLLDAGREKFAAPEMFVSADIVVLAAGTLGSTEIMLRSKDAGLSMSGKLGQNFTGNGDVLGFAYNNDVPINGIGFGSHPPEGRDPVGPCITGAIDARNRPELEDGRIIEEGSIPGAFAHLLPTTLAGAGALLGVDTDTGLADWTQETKREAESLLHGAYRGAVHHTQTLLVMTHDDAGGRLYLEDDRLRIEWPRVGRQPIFNEVNQQLEKAAGALGGTYVGNPLSTRLTGNDLITVHPLGGCSMGERAEDGVVNHKGQVFAGASGTQVYEGFYVCDGAIIPRPLGVNPLLTISALAERCCAILARERGWEINYEFGPVRTRELTPRGVGIQFTEAMRGHFSTAVKDDYENGAERGQRENSNLQFILTIVASDLNAMIADPLHGAQMTGNVIAPALSKEPLTVSEGSFNLFMDDPVHPGMRRMQYRMKLMSKEERTYYFTGFKIIRDDAGIDLWADTTTLYITLFDGDSEQGPVVGKGILRIDPADFVRQLTTLRATNAANLTETLRTTAKFGQLFAGGMIDSYGGFFSRSSAANSEIAPREKRALRAAAPEVYFFETIDNVRLRLTRYQGGNKGPVILAHGMGVSSLIFSIDTIETNLVEYLFAAGFDVWLLDYRASIDLASSKQPYTGDDVATKDFPAAVAKVQELTGSGSVQVLAHSFGSITFLMSLLAGLRGVRSAICSQGSAHIVSPAMTRIASGLRLPSILAALGVESLSAYVDTHADWLDRLQNRILRVYPVGDDASCDDPVCHRITFLYGQLYEHAQLNSPTHEALDELFGVANIKALEHLVRLVSAGRLVDAKGDDVYLPNLERLKIPITFIHGAEDGCLLPHGSKLTYDLLVEQHGDQLYRRHVIPGYGHMDCIFGKNAVEDVYTLILNHLEAWESDPC